MMDAKLPAARRDRCERITVAISSSWQDVALSLLLVMWLLLVACSVDTPTFCDQSGASCAFDARIDGPIESCTTPGPNVAECPASDPVCGNDGVCIGCTADVDCDGRGATSVCLGEPSGSCVACDEDDHQSLAVGTADDNCPTNGMQVCDGESHTCRACRADSECTSGVCNELNGECANTVLHVDSDPANAPSDINDCLSTVTPCLTVAGAMAKAVTGTRYVAIHAADVRYIGAGEIAVTGSASVYVKGIPDPARPNYSSELDRNGNGPILSVNGGSASLTVVGLTLSGASGTGDGDGVKCLNDARLTVLDSILSDNTHYGLNSTVCTLVVDRTIIRDNSRGGGFVEGDFSITNSFIHGNVGTNFGGLDISDLDPSDVFAHNTIYRNTANTDFPGGLRCQGSGTARHNIIYGSLGTIIEYNVLGCAQEYSLIGTTMAPGTGNITAATVDEVRFANIATQPFDLHLTAGSTAFGKGGPNDGGGRTVRDVDGDVRPTNMADLGADEIP